MILQNVLDLAEICAQKGITKAIICPGSRNAPLTLAFARHPDIECLSIPDERSAAFVGLGIALKTKKPVVLICTSGSAALNFAPAVAEAFFSRIPLVILTADRPAEWIDQFDGQTIYQENVYGKHCKKFFEFPSDDRHKDASWHAQRQANEAINQSQEFPPGPVHINLQFREPFYPKVDEIFAFNKEVKLIENETVNHSFSDEQLLNQLQQFNRILIIGGQQHFEEELSRIVNELSKKHQIPIITDVISNLHEIEYSIKLQDAFLKNTSYHESLKPDLIISFGKSVISKNLKLFFRKTQNLKHWHIQESGQIADTFQSLSKIVRCDPKSFFKALLDCGKLDIDKKFYSRWVDINFKSKKILTDKLNSLDTFSEFRAFQKVMDSMDGEIDLHLANSMAVRYANLIGIQKNQSIEVFANRGTSGIDGSVSTALGATLTTDKTVYLLTGDMAFFYDRNAFWHNLIPTNLKIVVFNNHGGGIFRLIDGPSAQPELDEFFETKQKLSAEYLAKEYGFNYFVCTNEEQLELGIVKMKSSSSSPFILEIESQSDINKRVYKEIMSSFESTHF